MTPPRYQGILKDEIPVVQLAEEAGDVRVIAGNFEQTPGRASTFSPVNVWDIRLVGGKTTQLTIPVGHNTILFVRKGDVEVEGDSGKKDVIGSAQGAILTTEGTTVTLKVNKHILLCLLVLLCLNTFPLFFQYHFSEPWC